jgi:hypothetical protein
VVRAEGFGAWGVDVSTVGIVSCWKLSWVGVVAETGGFNSRYDSSISPGRLRRFR